MPLYTEQNLYNWLKAKVNIHIVHTHFSIIYRRLHLYAGYTKILHFLCAMGCLLTVVGDKLLPLLSVTSILIVASDMIFARQSINTSIAFTLC